MTKNAFLYPVPKENITKIVTDNPSHIGEYSGSIDFAVALGTPILAAADGEVVRVRDESEKHGQDPSFGPQANYITIEHSCDELSEYLHLAKDSALVRVGEHVTAGQQIALSGLSGWMYAPHVHFMVYSKPPKPFQCLNVKFIDS